MHVNDVIPAAFLFAIGEKIKQATGVFQQSTETEALDSEVVEA